MPLIFFLTSSCSSISNENSGRLAYLIILLLFLLPAIFRQKSAAKHLLIWIIIFACILIGYSYKDEIQTSHIATELFPKRAITNQQGEIIIGKSSNGHFKLIMEVNNKPINFLLDTGASDIVLDPKDATLLGIDTKKLSYIKLYQTANGIIRAAPLTLSQIKLGKLTFYNVKAVVNEHSSGGSLLGMSFLNLFSSYEVRGDKIYLRKAAR